MSDMDWFEIISAFAADIHPRLHLRSPYREHLAQAFARFLCVLGCLTMRGHLKKRET